VNETDIVRGVIVTHARLGEALIEAAEEISGVEGVLTAVSNRSCTPEGLRRQVVEATAEGPSVLFVDLAAGSCGFASRAAASTRADVAVVTGVSLPMLLDFLFHRDLPVSELAARLVEKGRANITSVETESRDDAARSVPD
jgi:mannose/fructose-specific phosphotransferase system component IIA